MTRITRIKKGVCVDFWVRWRLIFLSAGLFFLCMAGCGGDSGKDVLSDAAVSDGTISLDSGGDGGEHSDSSASDDGGLDSDGSTPTNEDWCRPLPAPAGEIIEVTQAEAADLRSIVMSAGSGTTILLDDGVYDMGGGDTTHRLSFNTDGVTLRSASGVPENVILDGSYVTGELISIAASDITIAEITLKRAYYHPIHVTGGGDRDTENTHVYRVQVIDPGQQAIKINPSSQGHYTDRGKIECCHIELTDLGRPEIRDNCYTGGVDAHAAWDWEIRDNTIVGFWCDSGLSEHGIHLWRTCRGTLVERNRIHDCARGIGFGLSETGGGSVRNYPDDPYPASGYMDHIDGIIRNNFVFAGNAGLFSSSSGFDNGISLAQARGAQVYHNTVVSTQAPFASIEWRFPNTDAVIVNNLVTHNLIERNGAQALLDGNIDNAPLSFFVDVESGDLHLDPNNAGDAVDSGADVDPGHCDEDIDGDSRSNSRDVGADELIN